MKLKQFFFALMASAVVFTACGKSDDKNDDPSVDPSGTAPTSMLVTPSTGEVEVGKTLNLSVVFLPQGSSASVQWVSENPAIASVVDGVVTGVAVGKTTITAVAGSLTANASITVKESSAIDGDVLLNGSEYYLLYATEPVVNKLGSKIKANLAPNGEYGSDATVQFELWNPEASQEIPQPEGSAMTVDPFGNTTEWLQLVVWNPSTWNNICGGFRCYQEVDLTAIAAAPNDYTFVAIYKCPDSNNNSEKGKLTLYSTVPDKAEYAVEVPLRTGSEWSKVEVPMSTILAAPNFDWSSKFVPGTLKADNSVMAFYSLGIVVPGAGNEFNLGAAFIYKK